MERQSYPYEIRTVSNNSEGDLSRLPAILISGVHALQEAPVCRLQEITRHSLLLEQKNQVHGKGIRTTQNVRAKTHIKTRFFPRTP